MSDAATPVRTGGLDRRAFMSYFAAAGLGGTLFPGVLWSRAVDGKVTLEMIRDAEAVSGIAFTEPERELMLEGLNENLDSYVAIRGVSLNNAVGPMTRFDPALPELLPPTLPGKRPPLARGAPPSVRRPENLEDVAFWPVTELSELIRTRQVRPTELTRMYLDRLKRHGPTLEAVITLTEARALGQAEQADREIAAGQYRGPLHGIPWGAKDLLATKGYPTTWGSRPYEHQVIDEDATVVRMLDDAGAILVAKLTLGELAWGDVWYGGTTRNPWNLEQGSSGSSAGPASATAAGLVGFSIGSETLGSIVSPSTRCGCSGLRPSYGRVSRHGAMALSWSMDKLGPICRSAEDCAIVFDAIRGSDGLDLTVRDAPFDWRGDAPVRGLRVGYLKSAFDAEHATKQQDDAVLDTLRGLGVELIPVEFEKNYPVGPLTIVLSAEAGAAFEELTLSGRDDLMKRQTDNAWPNVFRQAQLIPAVAYIQANRIRSLLIEETERALRDIDVLVTPSFGGDVLTRTNLTGHPTVVVPSGFNDRGSPVSISFVGRLWREAPLITLAKAYQEATGHHRKVPTLFAPGA